MDTQKLHDLIDKVIGKDGPLRTPAYWMRRVLRDIIIAFKESFDLLYKVVEQLESSLDKYKLENNSRIDGIDSRIDGIDSRIDGIDSRIDGVDAHAIGVDKRLDYLLNSVGLPYMTFTALEDGLTISSPRSMEYSIDGGEWASLPKNTATPPVNEGQKVALRGKSGSGRLELSAKCSVSGSPMSLYGDKIFDSDVPDNAFLEMFYNCTNLVSASGLMMDFNSVGRNACEGMFYGCTSLIDAPVLPATTLASNCYKEMFSNCTSLVTAPELPATTLAGYCYYNMFAGCTSLVNAPELPATTLASYCYEGMFRDCTALVDASELPATELVVHSYGYMFAGCTSLVNAPELPATTLAGYCYGYMFAGCTSLVNAPELPATELKDYCYKYMFSDCAKLEYIKALFISIPNEECLRRWVNNVASSGTFVKHPDATWNVRGHSGIPEGWTIETAAV